MVYSKLTIRGFGIAHSSFDDLPSSPERSRDSRHAGITQLSTRGPYSSTNRTRTNLNLQSFYGFIPPVPIPTTVYAGPNQRKPPNTRPKELQQMHHSRHCQVAVPVIEDWGRTCVSATVLLTRPRQERISHIAARSKPSEPSACPIPPARAVERSPSSHF